METNFEQSQDQRARLRDQLIRVYNVYFFEEAGQLIYDSVGPRGIISRLEELISSLENDINELTLSNEVKLSELRKSLTERMRRLTQSEMRVVYLKDEVKSKKMANQLLEAAMSKEPLLRSSLEKTQESILITKSRLEEIQSKRGSTSFEKQIDDIDDRIEEKTGTRNQLEREFIEVSSHSLKKDGYELLERRMKEKSGELERLLETNGSSFQDFFGINIVTCENILQKTSSAVEKFKAEENESNNKLQHVRQKIANFQGELKSYKQSAERASSLLESTIEHIRAQCEDYSSYPEVLEKAEMELEDAKIAIGTKQSAEMLYQEFLEYAKRRASCMVCKRSFGGSIEAHQFEVKLQEHIDNLPSETLEAKKEEEGILAKVKSLQQLRGAWDRCQELENVAILELNSKHAALKERLEQKQEIEIEIEPLVKGNKQKLEQALKLHRIAQDFTRIRMEHEKLLEEVKNEGEKLKSYDLDTRSSSNLLEAKEEIQKEIDNLIKKKLEIQENFHRGQQLFSEVSGECQSLENDKQNTIEKIERIGMDKQNLCETTTQISQNEEEILKLERNIESDKIEVDILNKNIVEQETRYKESETRSLNKKRDLEKSLIPLNSLWLELENTNIQDESEELDKLHREQVDTKGALDKIDGEIERHQVILNECEQGLANSDSVCHNVRNNSVYRQLRDRLKKEKADLDALVDRNISLSQDTENLTRDQKETIENREKEKSTWNKCKGVRIQLRDDVNVLQKEISSPKFSTIETDYRKKLVNVKVTEMSVKDLDNYYRALDRALVKYHSTKMAEINTTIKELWQLTYKGEDIDSIEIRSEIPTNSGWGKRAYDYRVVMVKGEVEIDMRSRCSAGQKVLASLVIRLSLAETFCVNCGILALDEPTTNLDRRNVESFANALMEIVSNRRNQKHFQLIVITHDEEFVQLLGRSDNTDYYWRVSKVSGGSSILHRHEIADLS